MAKAPEQNVFEQADRGALLNDMEARPFKKTSRIIALQQDKAFMVYTDRGPMAGQPGDWLVTNHPDDDPGSDLWAVSNERMEHTYEPVLEHAPHKPGDEHTYTGLVCDICGVKGQVQVSIVPITT